MPLGDIRSMFVYDRGISSSSGFHDHSAIGIFSYFAPELEQLKVSQKPYMKCQVNPKTKSEDSLKGSTYKMCTFYFPVNDLNSCSE